MRRNSTALAQRQVPNEVKSSLAPQVTGLATGVVRIRVAAIAAGGLNIRRSTIALLVVFAVRPNCFPISYALRNLIDSARLHADAMDQATEVTRAGVLLDVDRGYFNLLRRRRC